MVEWRVSDRSGRSLSWTNYREHDVVCIEALKTTTKARSIMGVLTKVRTRTFQVQGRKVTLNTVTETLRDRHSSVSVVTGRHAVGVRVLFPGGREIFLFSKASTPDLQLTQFYPKGAGSPFGSARLYMGPNGNDLTEMLVLFSGWRSSTQGDIAPCV
jgi:hypothetical protein